MRQETVAKLVELVELVNEQRWIVHEMRHQLKGLTKHSPRITTLTQQIDRATETDPEFKTLLSEVLYDENVTAYDFDQLAEALFDAQASPKPFKVEATVERVLKEARR